MQEEVNKKTVALSTVSYTHLPNLHAVRPVLCPALWQPHTQFAFCFRHFVSTRWLHPLAPLMRLSPVDLPSANSMKCCSPPASLILKIQLKGEA